GARAAAAALHESGVGHGDRVLIGLPDGFDLARIFLGTVRLGAVAVLVNPMLPVAELAGMLASADPAVVVCGPAHVKTFAGARIMAPDQMRDGDGPPIAAVEPTDPAYALFTSGTTGAPKLCFHSHTDPLVYDQAFGKPVLGIGPGDVTFSVSKMSFA